VIVVHGAERFTDFGRRLHEAADVGLVDELRIAISRFEPEAKSAVRVSALATLPRRGGLGRVVAEVPMSTRWQLEQNAVGFTLTAMSGHDIAAMDQGRLRHPLFGVRSHWFSQVVPPGWWSRPTEALEPAVRDAVESAVDRTRDRVVNGF
jgi:hypothetical protein